MKSAELREFLEDQKNPEYKELYEAFIECDYADPEIIGGHKFEHIKCTDILKDGTYDIIFKVDETFYKVSAKETEDALYGVDYDDYQFVEVEPVEKLVTVYKEKV